MSNFENTKLNALLMKDLQLTFLRRAVERKFDKRLSTTADFTALSEEMDERVSPSTIKRLWGYVGMHVTPRMYTLDVLAKYAGFDSYKDFCDSLRSTDLRSSEFFQTDRIDSAQLSAGDKVSIGWQPDRFVTMEYIGDNHFKILEADNSKLQPGDIFEAITIMKGIPLYISGIERDGKRSDPYVAGRDGGIVFVKKV